MACHCQRDSGLDELNQGKAEIKLGFLPHFYVIFQCSVSADHRKTPFQLGFVSVPISIVSFHQKLFASCVRVVCGHHARPAGRLLGSAGYLQGVSEGVSEGISEGVSEGQGAGLSSFSSPVQCAPGVPGPRPTPPRCSGDADAPLPVGKQGLARHRRHQARQVVQRRGALHQALPPQGCPAQASRQVGQGAVIVGAACERGGRWVVWVGGGGLGRVAFAHVG